MALILVGGGLNGDAVKADETASIDIAKLAQQFAAANPGFEEKKVVVLVSLGMPAASLRRLAKNASLANIPLVMRGLKGNSMRQTIDALRALKAHPLASWQVDPRLFRALDVNAVPAVAVIAGEEHLIVRGDVPLSYALAKLASQDSLLAAAASKVLAKLANKATRKP